MGEEECKNIEVEKVINVIKQEINRDKSIDIDKDSNDMSEFEKCVNVLLYGNGSIGNGINDYNKKIYEVDPVVLTEALNYIVIDEKFCIDYLIEE